MILHGKPKKEKYLNPAYPKPHEANWLPWLAGHLEAQGISAAIPAFPEPYAPDYERWREVFEQCHIDEETALIGHSAGAGFIIRWLSENPDVRIEKAILVAPWHDTDHEYGRSFFDYEIDLDIPARVLGGMAIVSSMDDGENIQASVRLLKWTMDRPFHLELDGYGHFMQGNKMEGTALPPLLGVVMSDLRSYGSAPSQESS